MPDIQPIHLFISLIVGLIGIMGVGWRFGNKWGSFKASSEASSNALNTKLDNASKAHDRRATDLKAVFKTEIGALKQRMTNHEKESQTALQELARHGADIVNLKTDVERIQR